jgi:hypothetical protein
MQRDLSKEKKLKKRIKKQNKAGFRQVAGRVLQGMAALGGISAPKDERGTAAIGALTLGGIGEAMVQAEKHDRKKKKQKLKKKLHELEAKNVDVVPTSSLELQSKPRGTPMPDKIPFKNLKFRKTPRGTPTPGIVAPAPMVFKRRTKFKISKMGHNQNIVMSRSRYN